MDADWKSQDQSKHQAQGGAKRGDPPNTSKKEFEKKICIKCKQKTGPGIPHPCTKNSYKKNLADLIGEESVTSQEQVLGESLKSLVSEKGGEPGEIGNSESFLDTR